MGITLNSLTHGYAADRVAKVFAAHGVQQAFVDTGEMEALGRNARARLDGGFAPPRQADAMLGTAPLTGCHGDGGRLCLYVVGGLFPPPHPRPAHRRFPGVLRLRLGNRGKGGAGRRALHRRFGCWSDAGLSLLRRFNAEAYGVTKHGEVWASPGFPRQNLALIPSEGEGKRPEKTPHFRILPQRRAELSYRTAFGPSRAGEKGQVMKISARNIFDGKIVEIKMGVTTAHVMVDVKGQIATAAITDESVEGLGLKVGQTVKVVIKSSDVLVAVGDLKISARNVFAGKVVEIKKGATTSHVMIDVKGQVVTASITNESVEGLGLKIGQDVKAVIKSSEVMIAID